MNEKPFAPLAGTRVIEIGDEANITVEPTFGGVVI